MVVLSGLQRSGDPAGEAGSFGRSCLAVPVGVYLDDVDPMERRVRDFGQLISLSFECGPRVNQHQ